MIVALLFLSALLALAWAAFCAGAETAASNIANINRNFFIITSFLPTLHNYRAIR